MNTPRRFELVALKDCPFGDGEPITDTGRQSAEYWFEHVATAADYDPRREWFAVLFLDQERRLFGHTVLPAGGESFVMASIRDIFGHAFAAGAANIVCLHNHPTGDVTPSPADLNHLRPLLLVSRLLEISVLDDLIVAETGEFWSAKEAGLLESESRFVDEQQEPDRERERSAVFMSILESDYGLSSLVFNSAFKAIPPQPAHDFFFDLVRKFVKGHLTAEPGSDPKLSLAAMLFRPERSPGEMFAECWRREAEAEGKAVVDFIWSKALSLLKEYEAAWQTNSNAPSAARVAAASV